MIICNIQMQVQNQADNDHESFYSINNSKSEFTFVEEPLPEPTDQIMHRFDIRQSSAMDLSSNPLNKSIASQEPMGLDDISVIHQQQSDQMSCSMCLQKEIDSLTLPNQPTQEELKALQENISRLRKDQSILKQQMQVFQGLMTMTKNSSQAISKASLQANKFVKKSCEHSNLSSLFNIPWPDPNQLAFTQLQQPQIQRVRQNPKQQHFDIKPSKSQSAAQKQANIIYKRASLQKSLILFDDNQNKYRIVVEYEQQHLNLQVVNYQKGETNFIYAARINDSILGSEKISQKFIVSLKNYQPKKFTLTVSVVLLIFKNGKQKEENNLLQAEQIRSLSLPLPINYFVCSRFVNGGIKSDVIQKLEKRLYIYKIDINYGVDGLIHKQLNQFQWAQKHWISLRGSNQLLWVDLGVVKEHEDGFRLVFRVGSKQRDAQQSIDLIEYLCFMLAL